MSILRTLYNSYLPELHKARARMRENKKYIKDKSFESKYHILKRQIKRDTEIIKIISKMITRKNLSEEAESKLNSFIMNSHSDK